MNENEKEVIEEKVLTLRNKMTEFLTNAEQVTNKAAARRARLLAMVLRNMLKEFKTYSIK